MLVHSVAGHLLERELLESEEGEKSTIVRGAGALANPIVPGF